MNRSNLRDNHLKIVCVGFEAVGGWCVLCGCCCSARCLVAANPKLFFVQPHKQFCLFFFFFDSTFLSVLPASAARCYERIRPVGSFVASCVGALFVLFPRKSLTLIRYSGAERKGVPFSSSPSSSSSSYSSPSYLSVPCRAANTQNRNSSSSTWQL